MTADELISGRRVESGRSPAKGLEKPFSTRTPGGVSRKQTNHEAVERFGYGRVPLGGPQDQLAIVRGGIGGGGPASERLVQHNAHGVPVGGWLGMTCSLFGGHVTGSAGAVQIAGYDTGDEAEIENDNAAVGFDQNVGGLDVAMELAGGVDGGDAEGQLVKGIGEAVEIDDRRSCGAAGSRYVRLAGDEEGGGGFVTGFKRRSGAL